MIKGHGRHNKNIFKILGTRPLCSNLIDLLSRVGISVKRLVSSTHYDEKVNTFKAKCGGSLEMWETSGWIDKIDPYGAFLPKLFKKQARNGFHTLSAS